MKTIKKIIKHGENKLRDRAFKAGYIGAKIKKDGKYLSVKETIKMKKNSPTKNKATLKGIAKNLKKSSKVHAKQSKQIESIMKNKASALKLKKSPALAKLSASCKAAAKRKFKVYPSAYANMWAAKTQRQGKC